MEIPGYIISALCRHARRVAEHATCDRSDIRTGEALRLLKEDLRRVEKHLPKCKVKENI